MKGLQLSERHRQQMVQHITACLPEEACGLIGGRGRRGEVVISVTNELHSPVRFRMDAAEQVKALLWLEKHGLELLAIYHSHPAGPGYPSITDLEEYAYPEAIAIIWTAGQQGWQARGFRLDQARFLEVPILWSGASNSVSDEGFTYPEE